VEGHAGGAVGAIGDGKVDGAVCTMVQEPKVKAWWVQVVDLVLHEGPKSMR